MSSHASPQISFVIPLHDQEAIVEAGVRRLRSEARARGWSYEIILSENGSRDHTAAAARGVCQTGNDVRVLSILRRNAGEAQKVAILATRGQFVVCHDLAAYDPDFLPRAVDLLAQRSVDLVLGVTPRTGALARAAHRLQLGLLRVLIGFRGSELRGAQAFRRATLLPVIRRCRGDRQVFAPEVVVRAQRAGLNVQEIPLTPTPAQCSAIPWTKRARDAIATVARLTWYLRSSKARPR